MEDAKERLFVRGSVFLILSNVCIKTINFFLLPLYTKNLTPSMLGVSDSITTFTGILLPILVLGLDSAYSAFYFDNVDLDRDKKVFGTLGYCFFALGILPLLMCSFSDKLSDLIFHTNIYGLEVMLALAGVSLKLWGLPFSLELRLKNQMGKFGIVSVISSISMILLNVLFVTILKLGTVSLIISDTIVAGEMVALYAWKVGRIPQKIFIDRSLLKRMLTFALPIIPTVLMAWVLSLSDRYILLWYCGDSSVGIYGIGSRFATVLNVIIGAVTTAYTTFAFGSKDDEDAKDKYYRIFNIVSVLLLFCAFTVSIFGKEIISTMVDAAFQSTRDVIRDLMFGQVLYAMSTIVSYGIFFKKKSVYSLVAVSLGAVVNIILNFALIPSYGIRAAAFSTVVGYLSWFLAAYYFSEKLYPCNYGVTRVCLSALVVYIICTTTQELAFGTRIWIWWGILLFGRIVYRDIVTVLYELIKKIRRRH